MQILGHLDLIRLLHISWLRWLHFLLVLNYDVSTLLWSRVSSSMRDLHLFELFLKITHINVVIPIVRVVLHNLSLEHLFSIDPSRACDRVGPLVKIIFVDLPLDIDSLLDERRLFEHVFYVQFLGDIGPHSSAHRLWFLGEYLACFVVEGFQLIVEYFVKEAVVDFGGNGWFRLLVLLLDLREDALHGLVRVDIWF